MLISANPRTKQTFFGRKSARVELHSRHLLLVGLLSPKADT